MAATPTTKLAAKIANILMTIASSIYLPSSWANLEQRALTTPLAHQQLVASTFLVRCTKNARCSVRS
jgi:hypothetical protein